MTTTILMTTQAAGPRERPSRPVPKLCWFVPLLAVVILTPPMRSSDRAYGQPAAVKFEAFVEPFNEAKVEEMSYATYNARGRLLRPTRWRVVTGTGNKYENYLASTKEGMLLDFGGAWVRVSSDHGVTWSEVLPAPELRGWWSFEGAVAAAPGGDVVAVGQDAPIDGVLRVPTFKYEAESKKWFYSAAEVHAPLVDRPGVAVIPGPFALTGGTVPYVSVMRGGFYVKAPFMYSFDGLNYSLPSSRLIDQSTNLPRSGPLKVDRWSELDWIQPHELIGVTPYGRGKAMAERPWYGLLDPEAIASRTILDPATLRWSRYEFPSDNAPKDPEPLSQRWFFGAGRTLADSQGRLHHVSLTERTIEYMISPDGGRKWSSTSIPLLAGYKVRDVPADIQKAFRVSGEHRTAVLAVHAVAQEDPLVTRDLVYRFSVPGTVPRVTKIYALGTGSYSCFPIGISAGDGSCDFPSITLLPGGRIAASFTDAAHREPAVAIQLGRRS